MERGRERGGTRDQKGDEREGTASNVFPLELCSLQLPLVLIHLGAKRHEGGTHTWLEGWLIRGAASLFVPLEILRSQHLLVLVQGGARGEGEAGHKRPEGCGMKGSDFNSLFFSST